MIILYSLLPAFNFCLMCLVDENDHLLNLLIACTCTIADVTNRIMPLSRSAQFIRDFAESFSCLGTRVSDKQYSEHGYCDVIRGETEISKILQ